MVKQNRQLDQPQKLIAMIQFLAKYFSKKASLPNT